MPKHFTSKVSSVPAAEQLLHYDLSGANFAGLVGLLEEQAILFEQPCEGYVELRQTIAGNLRDAVYLLKYRSNKILDEQEFIGLEAAVEPLKFLVQQGLAKTELVTMLENLKNLEPTISRKPNSPAIFQKEYTKTPDRPRQI